MCNCYFCKYLQKHKNSFKNGSLFIEANNGLKTTFLLINEIKIILQFSIKYFLQLEIHFTELLLFITYIYINQD